VVVTPDGNAYAYSFQRDIGTLYLASGLKVRNHLSAVRDHQQRSRAFDHALHGALQILGIERGEAFVQHHQIGVLQQRARDVQAAAFAVRKLPAGFTHHLQHAGGHALQQIARPSSSQMACASSKSAGAQNGGTAQKQIEGECFGQHVILVELRRGGQASAPFGGAENLAIEAIG
jgi:hypothetical protein